jgi:hypothetical protein
MDPTSKEQRVQKCLGKARSFYKHGKLHELGAAQENYTESDCCANS